MQQEPEQKRDFFISYTSADQRWAEWIAWQLETAGSSTHIQAWDSQAGSNFVLAMNTATIQAARTIAVLSPDYFSSKFTRPEWAAAFRQDPTGEHGTLIPVRVRSCDVKGLLGQIVYIDLVGLDEPTARGQLLERISRQRHKPAHAPAYPSTPAPTFPGALPPYWNIPYPPNPYFTGREELLSRLAEALRTGHPAAIGQPQAISGLGGIGKTQIAIEYTYRYYQDYQAVLWVRAETRDELISAYVALAGLLQLPQQEEKEQLLVVQAVKDWLRMHRHWLLILDNADDLVLAREFLPPASQGHILLTTRASSTRGLAKLIGVDTLNLEEGTHFLLRRAGLLGDNATVASADPQEVAQAQALVREMDGLPLALDQAGAYIEEIQCSIAHYLTLYRTHRADLLKERVALTMDHPQPVATTWSLSFQIIEERSLAAADLLRACAFLQPDAIPEEILREGGKHLGPHVQTLVADPLAFDQALKLLLSYSLIRRNASDELLSIHRLVQAVLIDGMDKQTQREWVERVVAAVHAVLPDRVGDHRQWRPYERCLVQALGCVALINHWSVHTTEAFWLLRRTAWYLYERARYTESEPLYQQALEIGEQVLGLEHPDMVYPLNGLAILYREQGKYGKAEPLYKRALQISERALGPEHPDVAYPLNSLAKLYYEQGKYGEAKPLYERALRIWEQALGPNHPQVAYPLNNLALLCAAQRMYGEAEALYQRVLQIREQVLGPEHFHVAYSLNGLADLYREQGEYRRAEPLYRRSLQIREQVLGSEHPHVADSLNGLALLYYEQGKYVEAEPLYEQALQIREQVLGSSHPRTRETARDYVLLLRAMKREREADELEARFSPKL